MPAVIPAFALILSVIACTPSKPSAADYIGVWTGARNGCDCMLNVAAYGSGFMIQNENECGACSVYQGVFALTAAGNLAGGSTGAVTLVYDQQKNKVRLRSGSAQQYMTKLSSQALARWRFAQRLMTRYGFKIDDEVTELCPVNGNAGRCELAPYPMAGARSRSCDVFATATYVGDCIDGMLSGLCLIGNVDHVAEGDVAMSYFAGGRALYPIFIANTRDTTHPFGLQADERVFYNCHAKFLSDNERYGCMQFRSLLGDDIFSRGAHDSLRKGTFDLAKYKAALEQRVAQ